MKVKLVTLGTLIGLGLITGCSESIEESSNAIVDTAIDPVEVSSQIDPVTVVVPEIVAECVDADNIYYLCGPENAEDILRFGNSEWLLASGMNGELSGSGLNGKIHLVNHQTRSYEILFPGDSPVLEHNTELFADCPGPLDVNNFSSHGLDLQAMDTGPQQYRLYMTSHGAREAIEIFEIDAFLKPTIKWVGCVPMPTTSWTNSVAALDDGGFFATQFMDPTGSGMAGVSAGEVTGHVFEWHPGEAVTILAGTDLSGPNGITLSDDERYIFVAAFGTHEVVRFDRSSTPVTKDSVVISVAPDNIRWNTDGTLYTAGGNVTEACPGPECGIGWSVIEIVPTTLAASRLTGVDETAAMQGVSSALLVDDEIWIGTYGGDRIGILPKP